MSLKNIPKESPGAPFRIISKIMDITGSRTNAARK
jgi:hypothetical protein